MQSSIRRSEPVRRVRFASDGADPFVHWNFPLGVDMIRSPSRQSAAAICALPPCTASSSHGSDPPTDPDEAWRLASEGGRELKVGRELRCHAVHRELISSVDPSLENPRQVPAFTLFGLAAVPCPP